MAHAPDTKEKKIHCLRISKEKLFVSVAVLMVVLGSLCFVDLIDCSEATGSGSCGEHLTWAVDQNGHLTVEGYGDMDDYSSSDLRWGGFNIRTVSLPDGLTSIGAYAFSDCWNLTAVDIQDSVTSIGDCAFYSCRSLGAIELPDSLETIGNQAFFECAALTSIHIPDSVTSIGANSTFAGCLNLAEITVGQNNVNYCSDDGVLYNKEKTVLIKYPSSKSGTTFSVPSTVTTIGKHAFSQCLSLTAVSILGPLTDLGDAAFFGCAYLSSVTIPDTLVTIGNQAFQGTGITTIDIPDSVTLIGISALADCNSLTAINVGNSNEYYSSVDGVLLNANKTSLYQYPVGKTGSSYTVPNTVTSIEYSAFIRNTSLTSVTIPNSVTVIEENAFSGCTSLSSINIPGSVVRIGGSAFAQTQLTSVTIPNSVTDMGNAAFRGCFSLETVVLSNNMNAIMGATFEGCDALSSVIIPNSVTYIGERAFCCCYSLESVTIPSSVTYIDNSAFSECRSITTVTIPNSVTYLGDWAFNQCTSLTTATIGNGLTTINQGVFEDCVSLTTLTIGEGVTSINTNAFSGCNRLIEINNRSEMALTPGSLDNGMVAFRALNIYTPMSGTAIVRFFDSQDGSDIFSVMYYDGRYWLTGVTTNDNCVDLPNGFTYDAANVTEYSIYGQVFAGTNLIHLGIPAAVISIDEAILDYVFYDPNAGYVIINSLEDMVGHTFSGDGINLYRDPTVTYYVDGVQVYQEMVKPGIPVAIRDRYVIIGYDVSDWALQTGVAAITESEFTPGATDVIFAATSTIRQFHVYYYVGDELTYTDTYDYNTLVNVRQNYSRIGYTVGGWTTEDVIVSEGRFVLGASNVTFRATSTVNNYGYTVNYYDNLGNVIREQYAGIAEYNSYVEPDIPVIAGYDAPLQTITIRISENGSQNVVNYVYTGHSNVYYYVDEELIHTDNNIYGAQVDVREVHSKRGYTVSPWSTQDVVVSNGRFIIGASDVTFRATSTRNSYSYTVNYINNDTGRQITNPFIGQALYGAEVTPDIVNHTGYDSPLLTVTIEISDDTSLNVVNYRYTPREYTYTFDTLGGSAIPSKTQKFGTYVSPPADPTKAGYIFDGWDNSIPSYMTAENLTFHAVWLDESELANMFILTNSGDLVWVKSDGFYVSQRITDTDLLTVFGNSGQF